MRAARIISGPHSFLGLSPTLFPAGRGLEELDAGEVALEREAAVIKLQRAADAILVELEAEHVGRRALAGPGLEVAERHRITLDLRELRLLPRLLHPAALALAADDGERVVDALAVGRAVEHLDLEDTIAGAGGGDQPLEVLGGQQNRTVDLEQRRLRLRQAHREAAAGALGAPVDVVLNLAVDEVLAFEAEGLRGAVLPGDAAQVAGRLLAIPG